VFAQDATPAAPTTSAPTPTPTTTTKHKPATNTVAYCNTLKSSTSKSACLKRVHAQHAQNATSKAGTTHKKTKKVDTTKAATSASAAPAPTPAPAPAPSGPQTINVPPLPQKTI
jgi:cobalamin-dependent methionine synthase I